jgi:hypothetical protein
MPSLDKSKLLFELLSATTSEEYRRILGNLGDETDTSFDTAFGPYGLVWKPYGNDQSNISTINIATKPGRTIAERITNGIDALFEQRVDPNVRPPSSARDAVQSWFGRPIPIHDEQTARWYRTANLDRRVNVIMLPGDDRKWRKPDALTASRDVRSSGVSAMRYSWLPCSPTLSRRAVLRTLASAAQRIH